MSLSLKIEMWPIDKIKPYPKNAKKHKVKWIASSIEKFDFDQPIVVDKDGVIIKGHGRLDAAKQLEIEQVPVIVRKDLTQKQVSAARLADNRCAQGGGFDMEMVGEELEFLKDDFDLNSLGFTDNFLKNLGKEDLYITDDNELNYDDSNDEMTYQSEKNVLSIVVDTEQKEKWQTYKDEIKKSTDTAAFIYLLNTL